MSFRESRAAARENRVVFVANIAYGTTEEQLIDLFNEIGPVLSFRLAFDRETGKPRGFGFCEFQDAETAFSAVRNMGGREFNGRPLRVDIATEQDDRDGSAKAERNQPPPPPPATAEAAQPAPSAERPFFPNIEQRSHLIAKETQDMIVNLITSMSGSQLFELMTQIKLLIQTDPEQARQLLLANPQLCYALLECQIYMGMINPDVIQNLISRERMMDVNAERAPVDRALLDRPHMDRPFLDRPPPPSSMDRMPPPPSMDRMPPPPLDRLPMDRMPIDGRGGGDYRVPLDRGVPIPPASFDRMDRMERDRGGMPPPPPPPPMHDRGAPLERDRLPPYAGGPGPMMDREMDQQQRLIQRVLSMTPEEIDSYPPEQREQLIGIRRQFQVGGFP